MRGRLTRAGKRHIIHDHHQPPGPILAASWLPLGALLTALFHVLSHPPVSVTLAWCDAMPCDRPTNLSVYHCCRAPRRQISAGRRVDRQTYRLTPRL